MNKQPFGGIFSGSSGESFEDFLKRNAMPPTSPVFSRVGILGASLPDDEDNDDDTEESASKEPSMNIKRTTATHTLKEKPEVDVVGGALQVTSKTTKITVEVLETTITVPMF